MTDTRDNAPGGSRVSSLRELNVDIAPSRDLWPAIEAQIAAEQKSGVRALPLRLRASSPRWLALAAIISALAVGVWVGRSALDGKNGGAVTPQSNVLQAAYVTTPEYVKGRAALVASYEVQLQTLPPQTREKVIASLASIRKSMQDIQDALGQEPGNALLQELLVNTYQDEMRVLTAVHEAGNVRKEI